MAKNKITPIEEQPKEFNENENIIVKFDEAIALLETVIQSLKKIEHNTFKGF